MAAISYQLFCASLFSMGMKVSSHRLRHLERAACRYGRYMLSAPWGFKWKFPVTMRGVLLRSEMSPRRIALSK